MHEITLKVGSPHALRDHIAEAVVGYSLGSNIRHTLEGLLEQVEQQLPKPPILEPLDFGSIVRATWDGSVMLWHPSPRSGKHYWESEYGQVVVWSELTDVEVVRVGLHDPDPNSYDDGVLEGKREMNTAIHGRVVSLLEGSLLKERATAYEHVLKAVEELAP